MANDAAGNLYFVFQYDADYGMYFESTYLSGDANSSNAPVEIGIIKCDKNSNVKWADKTDDNESIISALSADNSGNLYFTGKPYYYYYSSSYDTMFGKQVNYGSTFLFKLNSSGNIDWVQTSSDGGGGDSYNNLLLDKQGNPYITGSFYGSDIFGKDTLFSNGYRINSNSYDQDVFVVKYDTGGTAQWAINAGGIAYDAGNQFLINNTGDIRLVGTVGSTISYFGANTLVDSGGGDFLAAIDECNSPIAKISLRASCGKTPFILSTPKGSGYTYQWFRNDTLLSGATTDTLLPSGSGFYEVKVYNGSCSAVDFFAPVNTFNFTVLCPKTLLADSVNGFSCQWYLNDTAISGAAGLQYIANLSGNYAVQYYNSCGNKILSPQKYIFDTAYIKSSACFGDSIKLQAFPNDTNLYYYWYFYNGYIWGANSSSYVAKDTGWYYVNIWDRNGCGYKSNTIFFSNNKPVLTFNGDTCSPLFTASDGYTYQWYKNDSTMAGATGQTFFPKSPGKYSVLFTNSCGDTFRSAPQNFYVQYLDSAYITYTGSTVFCSGDSLVLNAPKGYNYIYNWQVNGNTVYNGKSSTYAVKIPYRVSVIINSSSGCSQKAPYVYITTIHAPHAAFTYNNDSCASAPVLTADSVQGCSYLWYRNDTALFGDTGIDYIPRISGNYSVQLTNSTGCSSMSPISDILVGGIVPVTITPSGKASFCIGDSIILRASKNTYFTYQWLRNNVDIYNATGATHIARDSGNFSVKVDEGSGCIYKSSSVHVSISLPPKASFTNHDSCSPILKADSVAGCTYQWYSGGSILTGDTSIRYNVTNPGNYSVQVTNPIGCVNMSASQNIAMYNVGNIAILTFGIPAFCQGDSAILLSSDSNNYTYTYQWLKNDKNIPGATAYSYTTYDSGKYSVNITNNYGCSKVAGPISVAVYPLPPVPVISQNGDTLISSSVSGNQWYLDSNLILGVTFHKYIDVVSGSYTVTTTDTNGCSATSAPYNYMYSGIEIDNSVGDGIYIYPNPSQNTFNIQIRGNNLQQLEVSLSDILGHSITSFTTGKNEFTINANDYNMRSGAYLLTIHSGSNVFNAKLMVQ